MQSGLFFSFYLEIDFFLSRGLVYAKKMIHK